MRICAFQYAFLVTSVVQFAGGVVVFFGLLTSPKEIGKLIMDAADSLLLGFSLSMPLLFLPLRPFHTNKNGRHGHSF